MESKYAKRRVRVKAQEEQEEDENNQLQK